MATGLSFAQWKELFNERLTVTGPIMHYSQVIDDLRLEEVYLEGISWSVLAEKLKERHIPGVPPADLSTHIGRYKW